MLSSPIVEKYYNKPIEKNKEQPPNKTPNLTPSFGCEIGCFLYKCLITKHNCGAGGV